MSKNAFVLLLSIGALIFHGCTPNYGCTETTADNYDINAVEDDGTCIPARDKLIGNYIYYGFWTDVITGMDTVATGNMQITEANTSNIDFNLNVDGQRFFQGSVSQNAITFETHVMGTSTYNGTGSWLEGDSVDAFFNMVFNDQILPAPQQIDYYLTKIN